jgi:N utilization substance protein B
MKSRTKARQTALQALYQIDIVDGDVDEALASFMEGLKIGPEARSYSEAIVKGVISNTPMIDGLIEEYSENWTVARMLVVDRNILRIAAYELLYCPDVPYKVVIDEAVELAKKYGSEDSGAFINGILDRMAKAVREEKATV